MKIKYTFFFPVAIDLIVQHIREFLNNRQKAEANNTSASNNVTSSHITLTRVSSGDGHLKRPH